MAGARVATQRFVPAGDVGAQDSNARGENGQGPAGRAPAGIFELRPRGAGALLDQAFGLLQAYFGPCVGFAALCFIPMQLLDAALRQTGFESPGTEILWAVVQGAGPKLLITAFVACVVAAPFLGRSPGVFRAFGQAFLALPGLTVILITQIIVSIGMCCFGIFTPWVFSPIAIVYVLERKEIRAWHRNRFGSGSDLLRAVLRALARGARLTLGTRSFGRWLAILVVASCVVYLPLVLLPSAANIPETRVLLEDVWDLPGGPVRYALVAIGAVFIAIGTVFLDILMTVFYLDLRVRREALDLEMELESLVALAGRARGF